jgi:hypothetical protein
MMKTMKPEFIKLLKTIIPAVILVAVFYLGGFIGQAKPEIQAATNQDTNINQVIQARVIEIKTVQYIEGPAEPAVETVYVEPAKTADVELRNFNNLAELQRWLEAVRNITAIRFQYPDAPVDCDDYALELQQRAIKDGYLMSFQIIEPARFNAIFKDSQIPPDALHAINLVVIGNGAYYIEPQTGEIVVAAQID